jgi:hypothetical protein
MVVCSVVLIDNTAMSRYIFTKHSLERLRQRSIAQSDAESVLAHPDRTEPGKKPGTVKFMRLIHGRNIQLIATYLEDQKKWLIVSAWVRGEDDRQPLLWTVLRWIFQQILKKLR